jgi:hypothetical protein
MAQTTVAYWQHVGTGEVFAVRVGDDGRLVSARGPLAPAEVGAVIFGAPALGTAWRGAPTTAGEETDATTLDHLRGATLDRDTEYISLAPFDRHQPGPHDEGGADA